VIEDTVPTGSWCSNCVPWFPTTPTRVPRMQARVLPSGLSLLVSGLSFLVVGHSFLVAGLSFLVAGLSSLFSELARLVSQVLRRFFVTWHGTFSRLLWIALAYRWGGRRRPFEPSLGLPATLHRSGNCHPMLHSLGRFPSGNRHSYTLSSSCQGSRCCLPRA
jgi:hypothetical protein